MLFSSYLVSVNTGSFFARGPLPTSSTVDRVGKGRRANTGNCRTYLLQQKIMLPWPEYVSFSACRYNYIAEGFQ